MEDVGLPTGWYFYRAVQAGSLAVTGLRWADSLGAVLDAFPKANDWSLITMKYRKGMKKTKRVFSEYLIEATQIRRPQFIKAFQLFMLFMCFMGIGPDNRAVFWRPIRRR